jgi:hypothetical protein
MVSRPKPALAHVQQDSGDGQWLRIVDEQLHFSLNFDSNLFPPLGPVHARLQFKLRWFGVSSP